MRAFEPVFRLDLAHGLCIGVRLPPPDADTPPEVLGRIPEAERAFASTLSSRRRITWVGGRLALREALRQLGAPCGPVLATPRGAPALPVGLAGSISHKDALAVALVARNSDARTLGIDIEEPEPPRQHIAPRVLTADELAEVEALPAGAERWRSTLVRFSIKEAIYKAIDPFLHRYVAFEEVGVHPAPDGGAAVRWRLAGGESPPVVETRWLLHDGLVLTTASAHAPRASGPSE
ncbi:MAG: 4'-phosphopantetheinyl transferase superfamily protein [Planctomycetes bacterium]|nr:4'-phosphopantetheinyl transferase superfamily protein [Planctomycetota bacterium]